MTRTWTRRFHAWFIFTQSKIAAQRIAAGFVFSSALEIGSSVGWLSKELRRITNAKIVSSDISVMGNDVVCADAHCLPFKDGEFDLLFCSNTLEHLHSPQKALSEMRRVGKQLWLSWTPWWSPFGGHDFAPWHYFGKRQGLEHRLGVNLYKTTVAETLKQLNKAGWQVDLIQPRYWPALGFLARWLSTREWATWNVEVYCSPNKDPHAVNRLRTA